MVDHENAQQVAHLTDGISDVIATTQTTGTNNGSTPQTTVMSTETKDAASHVGAATGTSTDITADAANPTSERTDDTMQGVTTAETEKKEENVIAPSDGSSSSNQAIAASLPEGAPDALVKAIAPDGPPSLHYTLNGRKKWIGIFWGLVLFDSIVMPLVLYFALWYKTSLTHNEVFSISTAALGGISIAEYFLRFWRLWKKNSNCRPVGSSRKWLDWFHIQFSIAWIYIMVELIVGTTPEEPPRRLLAMPVSSLCYWFAVTLLAQDILRYYGFRQPVRISSVPKGAPFRPGIYSLIEDVVAVDGSGGTEFRINLDLRFKASHDFRQMLHRLTAYWGAGALLVAVLTTVLVFTLEVDAAYVVGWTVPFIWAGVFSWGTIYYVKSCLKHERENWNRV